MEEGLLGSGRGEIHRALLGQARGRPRFPAGGPPPDRRGGPAVQDAAIQARRRLGPGPAPGHPRPAHEGDPAARRADGCPAGPAAAVPPASVPPSSGAAASAPAAGGRPPAPPAGAAGTAAAPPVGAPAAALPLPAAIKSALETETGKGSTDAGFWSGTFRSA